MKLKPSQVDRCSTAEQLGANWVCELTTLEKPARSAICDGLLPGVELMVLSAGSSGGGFPGLLLGCSPEAVKFKVSGLFVKTASQAGQRS